MTTRAVVDIGTNSVKLLIATVDGTEIDPLDQQSVQTRLGRGLYETRRLSTEAIAATAKVLADYRARADSRRASSFRVLATSAARDAENGHELAAAIRAASGAELEIISGDREAALVYAGVRSQSDRSGQTVLAVDVGGGSTEFILGDDEAPLFSASYQLGTVRMLSRMQLGNPPGGAALEECLTNLRRLLATEVAPRLGPAMSQLSQAPLEVIGPGGTTTFLARIHHATDEFDRQRFEATRFSVADLRSLTGRLWNMNQSERENLPGLPANRADVILLGTAIYLAVLEQFNVPHLRVCTRGLRFGLLLEH